MLPMISTRPTESTVTAAPVPPEVKPAADQATGARKADAQAVVVAAGRQRRAQRHALGRREGVVDVDPLSGGDADGGVRAEPVDAGGADGSAGHDAAVQDHVLGAA
jgi:hypothetical protein